MCVGVCDVTTAALRHYIKGALYRRVQYERERRHYVVVSSGTVTADYLETPDPLGMIPQSWQHILLTLDKGSLFREDIFIKNIPGVYALFSGNNSIFSPIVPEPFTHVMKFI